MISSLFTEVLRIGILGSCARSCNSVILTLLRNAAGLTSPALEVREVGLMGRIIMVVTVWLVMAAMMLVIALPVLGKTFNHEPGQGNQGPFWRSGNGNPGTSSDVIHSGEGACVVHQGTTTGKTTGGGCQEEVT